MIEFGQLLCIIQNILFLGTLISFEVIDSEKFGIIFMICWIISLFLSLLYSVFDMGV